MVENGAVETVESKTAEQAAAKAETQKVETATQEAAKVEPAKVAVEVQKVQNSLSLQEKSEKANLGNLEQRLLEAEIQLEALKNGLNLQYLEDAMILAAAKRAKNNADYKTVFAELKTKYPVWFESEQKKAKQQQGTGSAVAAGGAEQKQTGALGKRLAAQKKAKKTTSFWKN